MASSIETSCLVNQQCSGIDCGLVAFVAFYVEADIQPCEKPPGILLVVRDSNFQLVYEGYFNSTTAVLVPLLDLFSLPVNVMITQNDYSIEVEVKLELFVVMATLYIAVL